jgi:hypothetical protein
MVEMRRIRVIVNAQKGGSALIVASRSVVRVTLKKDKIAEIHTGQMNIQSGQVIQWAREGMSARFVLGQNGSSRSVLMASV